MKKMLFKSILFAIVISLCGCNKQSTNNFEIKTYKDGSTEIFKDQTIFFNKDDGFKFNVLSDDLTTFVNNYNPGDSINYSNGYDIYYPNSLLISWNDMKAKYYMFNLGTNFDMTSSVPTKTAVNRISLDSLFIGTTYYYRVDAVFDGYTHSSKVYSFTTDQTVRTINIEGVSNTRDIGGAYTEDGNYRMKQGFVYRGANIDHITYDGMSSMVKKLAIKTDMDLREPNVTEKLNGVSPLGEEVNYLNYGNSSYGCPYYIGGSTGIDTSNKDYKEALLNHLKAFADVSNYPIYFHCAIGRDRTGTVAYLIERLCGYSMDRILLDYEFSFMSQSGCNDNPNIDTMLSTLINIERYINNLEDSGTSQEKVESFMLKLGLTQTEIDSIKSILLEKAK